MVLKYAVCSEVIGKHAYKYIRPWIIHKDVTFFDTVAEIPNDYILLSSHFSPWKMPLQEWIRQGKNYIEIDYGYWGYNNPRRDTRRVTFNNSHNLKIKEFPYSRIHTLKPDIEDWKEPGNDYVLVILPLGQTLYDRTGLTIEEWQDNMTLKIRRYWKGDILWRKKLGGKDKNRWSSFLDQLQFAKIVVGERTMACVEAAMLGYQSISTDFSAVSLLMGTDLSIINNPIYPDRNIWFEHIAWSQFHLSEFEKESVVPDMVEIYQIFPNLNM